MSGQRSSDKKDVQNLAGKFDSALNLSEGDAASNKATMKDFRPDLNKSKSSNVITDTDSLIQFAKDKVASKEKRKKKNAAAEKYNASYSKSNVSANSGTTQSVASSQGLQETYASKLKASASQSAVSVQDRLQSVQTPVAAPISNQTSAPSRGPSYVSAAHPVAAQLSTPTPSAPSPTPVARVGTPGFSPAPVKVPTPVPVETRPVAEKTFPSAGFVNSHQQPYESQVKLCTNFDDILKNSTLNPEVIDFQPGRRTQPRVQELPQVAAVNSNAIEAAVDKLIEDYSERKHFFKQNLAYYVQNHLKTFLINPANFDILIRTLLAVGMNNEDFMCTLTNLLTICATSCNQNDFISHVISMVRKMSKEYNHAPEENNFVVVMAYLYQGLAEKYSSESAPMSKEFCADIMTLLLTEDVFKVRAALQALKVALGRLEREHSSFFETEVASFLGYLMEQKSELRDEIQQIIHNRAMLRQYQDEELLHEEINEAPIPCEYVPNLSQPTYGPDGQLLTEEEIHFLHDMSQEVDCIRFDQLGEIFDEAIYGEDEMDDDAYNALDEFLKTIPK